MRASELAYAAAREMSQRGHCKNVTENPEGQVCLYGALNRAEGLPAPVIQEMGLTYSYEYVVTAGKMEGLLAALTAAPLSGMKVTLMTTSPQGAFVNNWTDSSTERQLVMKVIGNILNERGFADWTAPHLYNDQEDISGEDVIQLFKETAFRLEAEGR